jgi:glutathione S-transferase
VSRETATLYVIPGSHPCKAAELMLQHKGIAYRKIEFTPGLHSLGARLHGFPGKGEARTFGDGGSSTAIAMGDRFGTVPALRIGEERLQPNHTIARRLDELRPEPPLFPADPDERAEVEEAERFGDDEFQMLARRLTLAGVLHEPDLMYLRGGDGPMGPLLFHNERVRWHACRGLARFAFKITPESEAEMRARLPVMLDRVDAWIGSGVLNGETLNAGDYMNATNVALLWYRRDLAPEIEDRAAGALMRRVLPSPHYIK